MPSWGITGNLKGPTGAAGPATPYPFGAPVAAWQTSSGLSTYTAAGTLTSGRLSFVPFDVGPNSKTSFSAIGVRVNAAQVGGSTTTTLGVYADDGSGGYPNMVGGALYSGTIVLTATGTAQVSVAWNNVVPGRYWLAFLYVAATTPTTVATVYIIATGTSQWAAAPGTPTYGLGLSAQSALPTTQVTLSATASNVIAVSALVSARTVP